MKKLILLYIAGTMGGAAFSQEVKVNGVTNDAGKEVFHVTAGSGKDVIVDGVGNLKVGAKGDQVPAGAKVHVKGVEGVDNETIFRLSDESQGQGYLLMSKDDTGTATWIPKSFSVIEGKVRTSGNLSGYESVSVVSDTLVPLKLPPGIWMIMAKYGVKGNSGGYYYWTYLHDMNDDKNGFYDDRCPDKYVRHYTPNFVYNTKKYNSGDPNGYCVNPTTPGYNPNWFLEKYHSFSKALTVAGMLPEQVPDYYSTPTLNYIAEIRSDGKNPGDPGYEHELRLTFSTSAPTFSGIELVPGINEFLFNGYFFALRLDILGDATP
jgi:hypothetical protein